MMTELMTAVIIEVEFYDWFNGKNLPEWEVLYIDLFPAPVPWMRANPAPVSDYFTVKLSKCTSVISNS